MLCFLFYELLLWLLVTKYSFIKKKMTTITDENEPVTVVPEQPVIGDGTSENRLSLISEYPLGQAGLRPGHWQDGWISFAYVYHEGPPPLDNKVWRLIVPAPVIAVILKLSISNEVLPDFWIKGVYDETGSILHPARNVTVAQTSTHRFGMSIYFLETEIQALSPFTIQFTASGPGAGVFQPRVVMSALIRGT